jgi:hypothetical protein
MSFVVCRHTVLIATIIWLALANREQVADSSPFDDRCFSLLLKCAVKTEASLMPRVFHYAIICKTS